MGESETTGSGFDSHSDAHDITVGLGVLPEVESDSDSDGHDSDSEILSLVDESSPGCRRSGRSNSKVRSV